MTPGLRKVFLPTLLVVLAYMGARFVIYERIPIVEIREATLIDKTAAATEASMDYFSDRRGMGYTELYRKNLDARTRIMRWDWWVKRDLWVCLPRAFGLAAVLWLMWAAGGLRRWGWHGGAPVSSAGMMTAFAAAWIAGFAGYGKGVEFTSAQTTAAVAATVLVALWEEAAFRGAIFLALKERFSPRTAAVLSSILFAVYHIQALHFLDWPKTFLFGIAACAALHAGVGLPWLAGLHWAVDAAWIHYGSDTHLPYDNALLAVGSTWALLIIAVWAVWLLGKKERPELEAQAAPEQKG